MSDKTESKTLHELATEFVKATSIDERPTRWFWRGAWYVWRHGHYEPVGQEIIEREVLIFLKSRAITIRISTIRGIVDLLRLLQICDVVQAPSWISGGKSDPTQLVALKNGLLRIRKNGDPELLAHTPLFWGLSSTDFSYSKDATCEHWLNFLDQLWKDDSESNGILQEWFGYSLLPDTLQQRILAIIGPPRSGKSTVARVLTELLGRTNVASPSIHSISGSFGLWGMLDRKLAIIPDATLPKPCPALEEILKSISGEDSVDVHRKGMPPLTGVRLPTRLMLLANEPPAFQDTSGALERRLIVLTTDQSFYGKEDIHLTKKLLSELPGILNWAIEGLKRLWKRGRFPERKSNIKPEAAHFTVPDLGQVRKIMITYDKTEFERSRPRRSKRRTPNNTASSQRTC